MRYLYTAVLQLLDLNTYSNNDNYKGGNLGGATLTITIKKKSLTLSRNMQLQIVNALHVFNEKNKLISETPVLHHNTYSGKANLLLIVLKLHVCTGHHFIV